MPADVFPIPVPKGENPSLLALTIGTVCESYRGSSAIPPRLSVTAMTKESSLGPCSPMRDLDEAPDFGPAQPKLLQSLGE